MRILGGVVVLKIAKLSGFDCAIVLGEAELHAKQRVSKRKISPAKTQRRNVNLTLIFLLCDLSAFAGDRDTRRVLLLLQRVLNSLLSVFLVNFTILRSFGIVGCWSKCVSTLSGRETL